MRERSMPSRTQTSTTEAAVGAAYVIAAIALSYVAVQDDGANTAAALGLLLLASLVGALTQRTLMYLLPFVPWVLITLAVYVTAGGSTVGWNELWFFNLAIVGLLGLLAMMLTRAMKRLIRRSTR